MTKKLLLSYNLIICLLLTLMGALSAKSSVQLINSFIYLPITLYFGVTLLHRRQKTSEAVLKKRTPVVSVSSIASSDQKGVPLVDEVEGETLKEVPDIDKRAFLKLIGSAGISLFMLALFTKKAQAAFFGSVPGPGVVSLKDSAGNKIDPAEKHPTDGYKITELDDSGTPAYYGFVKKTGAWYILQDTNGAYRYTKGSSDFSTGWTGRIGLTYGYFNAIFNS